nr:hypothetical protein [Tanacetum cinerariifolium]
NWSEELNQDIDWSVAIDHVKQKAKEDSLDYFKGMSYDDICPIFEAKFNSNIEFLLKSKEQIKEEENRAIESINETPAQKANKRRKLNEDVEYLQQHLEIVPDEDDDVYTEATPLTGNVPVALWSLVKEKFSTLKAKNFSDDFFLTTLERRYLLLRFTLDQMLNAVRLQVEEESDMALELLSFGVDATMDLKEKKTLKVFTAAGEELSAVKQKLMLLDSAAEGRLILLSQVKTANDKCCC